MNNPTGDKFLYMSLKNRIKSDYSGQPYYTPLPGERELCTIYGVSRQTIRKSLQCLEKEGIIRSLHGKGTFFLGNKDFTETTISQGKREIAFYQQVVSRGNVPTSKVLIQNVEAADKIMALKLNIKIGDPVFCLQRLRYINGKLYSLSTSRISYNLCPQLMDVDFSDASLHRTLEQHGLHPYRAEKIIEIEKADEYDALRLNLKVGDPISITYTETYDANGNILEFVISKSDAYITQFEMTVFNSSPKHENRKE